MNRTNFKSHQKWNGALLKLLSLRHHLLNRLYQLIFEFILVLLHNLLPTNQYLLTISTVTNEYGVEDIEIDIYAENSPVPQTKSPAMKNPLVRCGIISEDLAEIFFPPKEAVPVGKKRPLHTKSKARVMTSDMRIFRSRKEALDKRSRTKEKETPLLEKQTKERKLKRRRIPLSSHQQVVINCHQMKKLKAMLVSDVIYRGNLKEESCRPNG